LDNFQAVISCLLSASGTSVGVEQSLSQHSVQQSVSLAVGSSLCSQDQSQSLKVSFNIHPSYEETTSQRESQEEGGEEEEEEEESRLATLPSQSNLVLCAETQQVSQPWSQLNRVEECSMLPDTQEACFVPGTLPNDTYLESPQRDEYTELEPEVSPPPQASPELPRPPSQCITREPTQDSVSAALAAFYATGVMDGTLNDTRNENTVQSPSEAESSSRHDRSHTIDETVGIQMESQQSSENACSTPTTQQCNELAEALAVAAVSSVKPSISDDRKVNLEASDNDNDDDDESSFGSQAVFEPPPKKRYSFGSESNPHVSPFQRQAHRLNVSADGSRSQSMMMSPLGSSNPDLELGAPSASSTGHWGKPKEKKKEQSTIRTFANLSKRPSI
jgi:hypothetical protein